MATSKKPLRIVTPAEWVSRTALTFSSRSGTTVEMDHAYTRWYNSRSQGGKNAHLTEEKYRSELQVLIETYYNEHGANWGNLARDKASGGLIKYIYELIYKPAPALVKTKAQLEADNAHSRYGVLYLLGNIDIDMDIAGIALEGVGAVGGALASGFGTNYSQIHDVDKVDKTAFSVFGQDVSVSDAFGYSSTVGTGLAQVGVNVYNAPTKTRTAARHGTRDITVHGAHAAPVAPSLGNWGGKGPPCAVGNVNYLQLSTRSITTKAVQSDYGFPLTVRAFKAMEKHPVAAVAFAPLSGAVLVGAAFTDAMAKVIEAVTWLVKKLVDWLKGKLSEMMESPVTVGLDTIKGLVCAVVKSCCAAAVPFVGAGIDLAVGIAKSFNAIKMKVGAWLERRKIRITEGHPALLAGRIESLLTRDILSGLWVTLKGAIQMALAATIPGIQSFVSAMATAVEWVIKLVMRLIELGAVKLFLLQAKVKFLEERKRTVNMSAQASRKTGGVDAQGREKVEFTRGASTRKVHTSGGLIHDLEEFKKFFQAGCNASPIIAILTLNSGICGSQWQLQTMLSDIDLPGNRKAIGLIGQKEFNTGTAYFSRLKQYGYGYLKDCGFSFKSNLAVRNPGDHDKRYIEGLLLHARGIHKQSDRQGLNSSGIAWASPG
jgi:hypothetical protein